MIPEDKHVNVTRRQHEVLERIRRGDPEGGFIGLDWLISNLPFKVTKQSSQFTIRALIQNGLIEKKARVIRRGRRRVTYGLTLLGYAHLSGNADIVEINVWDEG